jgi:hypothetical protein
MKMELHLKFVKIVLSMALFGANGKMLAHRGLT